MKYTMKLDRKSQVLHVFAGKELVNSFTLTEVLCALVDGFQSNVAPITFISLGDGEESQGGEN